MSVENITAEAETFTCNAYFVLDGTPTLVDAGSMPSVIDVLSSYSTPVDRVVITHQHGDHIEQLEAIVDAHDPAVHAYADHPLRTHAIDDGDLVTIGTDTYEAVHTPGHADDHLAFVSDTTVFTGDVVVHNDGAFDYGSFGRTDMPGQSREELIKSIRRLLDRLPEGVEHMYAGHGDEFHGDVRDVIETALERAEKREPKYPE